MTSSGSRVALPTALMPCPSPCPYAGGLGSLWAPRKWWAHRLRWFFSGSCSTQFVRRSGSKEKLAWLRTELLACGLPPRGKSIFLKHAAKLFLRSHIDSMKILIGRIRRSASTSNVVGTLWWQEFQLAWWSDLGYRVLRCVGRLGLGGFYLEFSQVGPTPLARLLNRSPHSS